MVHPGVHYVLLYVYIRRLYIRKTMSFASLVIDEYLIMIYQHEHAMLGFHRLFGLHVDIRTCIYKANA